VTAFHLSAEYHRGPPPTSVHKPARSTCRNEMMNRVVHRSAEKKVEFARPHQLRKICGKFTKKNAWKICWMKWLAPISSTTCISSSFRWCPCADKSPDETELQAEPRIFHHDPKAGNSILKTHLPRQRSFSPAPSRFQNNAAQKPARRQRGSGRSRRVVMVFVFFISLISHG